MMLVLATQTLAFPTCVKLINNVVDTVKLIVVVTVVLAMDC